MPLIVINSNDLTEAQRSDMQEIFFNTLVSLGVAPDENSKQNLKNRLLKEFDELFKSDEFFSMMKIEDDVLQGFVFVRHDTFGTYLCYLGIKDFSNLKPIVSEFTAEAISRFGKMCYGYTLETNIPSRQIYAQLGCKEYKEHPLIPKNENRLPENGWIIVVYE
jgi:hypothetical protein